jgi:uncharacterized protein YjeT (DUF2065 family)
LLKVAMTGTQINWISNLTDLPVELFLEIAGHLDPIDLLALSHTNQNTRRVVLGAAELDAQRQPAIKAQAIWRKLLDARSNSGNGAVARMQALWQALTSDDPVADNETPSALDRLAGPASGNQALSDTDRLTLLDDAELLTALAQRSDCLTPAQQRNLYTAIRRRPHDGLEIAMTAFATQLPALSSELRDGLIAEADTPPYPVPGYRLLGHAAATLSPEQLEGVVARIENIPSDGVRGVALRLFAVALPVLSSDHQQRLLAVAKAIPQRGNRTLTLMTIFPKVGAFPPAQHQGLIDEAKTTTHDQDRQLLLASFGGGLEALSPEQHEELVAAFEGFASSGSGGRPLGIFAAGLPALSPPHPQRLFDAAKRIPRGPEQQYALAGFGPGLAILPREQHQDVVANGVVPLVQIRPDLLAGLRAGLVALARKDEQLDPQLQHSLAEAIENITDLQQRTAALIALGEGLAPSAPQLHRRLVEIADKIADPKLRTRALVLLA